MLCHATALAGFFVPWAGHILGPLIVWLAKRSDSPEIDENGKESLNFQISMLIYNVIAGVLCLVLIGFILLAILHILNLVLVIIASIQTSALARISRAPFATSPIGRGRSSGCRGLPARQEGREARSSTGTSRAPRSGPAC